MNWRLIALPASIVPFVILFLTTNVTPDDVLEVGLIPFVLSSSFAMTRVLLQAVRFKYFINGFIGRNVGTTGKAISARLAGEFVTQTTPSFVGGEFVRIAWLNKNGVPTGKAAWITTMEIIADVFVGSTLAFIAGGLAIFRGGIVIGTAVILLTIPTFAVWFLLLFFSAKRNLRLPSFSLKIIQKFIAKEKAENLVNSANTAIADLCKMSRENFNSSHALKIFTVGLGITFVAFLFQGLSFMVLADSVGSKTGVFDSLMATSASTSLANLPITIGGSGLAELGIWAYLQNLNGIPTIEDVVGDSQLNVIIAWRIATYHVPLVISWIALMRIAVGKTATVTTTASATSMIPSNNNSAATPPHSPNGAWKDSISNNLNANSTEDSKAKKADDKK